MINNPNKFNVTKGRSLNIKRPRAWIEDISKINKGLKRLNIDDKILF